MNEVSTLHAAGTYYITYKTNDSVQSAVPSVLTVVVE